MKEIVFEVAQDADGGFTAEAIGESIFTQAINWEELKGNVREAVQAFYFDSVAPASIRLRLFGTRCLRSHETARGLSGEDLVKHLCKLWDTRGSTSREPHHSPNPAAGAPPHRSSGAFSAQGWNVERILSSIAAHKSVSKESILKGL